MPNDASFFEYIGMIVAIALGVCLGMIMYATLYAHF